MGHLTLNDTYYDQGYNSKIYIKEWIQPSVSKRKQVIEKKLKKDINNLDYHLAVLPLQK